MISNIDALDFVITPSKSVRWQSGKPGAGCVVAGTAPRPYGVAAIRPWRTSAPRHGRRRTRPWRCFFGQARLGVGDLGGAHGATGAMVMVYVPASAA